METLSFDELGLINGGTVETYEIGVEHGAAVGSAVKDAIFVIGIW